jgi:hypothetical protein
MAIAAILIRFEDPEERETDDGKYVVLQVPKHAAKYA